MKKIYMCSKRRVKFFTDVCPRSFIPPFLNLSVDRIPTMLYGWATSNLQ